MAVTDKIILEKPNMRLMWFGDYDSCVGNYIWFFEGNWNVSLKRFSITMKIMEGTRISSWMEMASYLDVPKKDYAKTVEIENDRFYNTFPVQKNTNNNGTVTFTFCYDNHIKIDERRTMKPYCEKQELL